MQDVQEFLAILAVAVAVIFGGAAVVGTFVVGAEFAVNRPACYATWRDSGLQPRWSFYGGCQVSPDGRHWMPDDAYVQIQKRVALKVEH